MCDPCIVIEISQQESKTKQQDVPIKKCNQDDSDSQGKKFFHRYGYYPAYIVSETLVQSKSSSSSIDFTYTTFMSSKTTDYHHHTR